VKFIHGLAALGLALACAASADARAKPEAVTVYRHANLVDGTGGPVRPGMAVVVKGERIASVLPDAELTPADLAGAQAVDLSGKYLAPGLIDSHEHLATPPNRRQAEASLRRDLYGGVTAVRDMADDLRAVAELARASQAGEIPAPDIYYAAFMAGPSFFDDPRTHAATYGRTPGQTPWMQAITDKTDLRTAVTLAKGTSATAIKIYANLSGELVAKIAAEAHRQGMLVWAHSAVYPATPAQVLAAKPDAISHACAMASQVVGTPGQYKGRPPIDEKPFLAGDNPVMARLFQTMKAQGTILDATASIYAYYGGLPADPNRKPPLCTGPLAAALTGQAYRAGVAISTGTDWVTPYTDPWPTLHHELAALVKAGMPPAQVIRSATLIGARAAGQEKDMGTVAPGKLANLIVLAQDPTADIENLKTLERTVKRGRDYPRAGFRPLVKADLEGPE
jgi:hypothetical protein